MMDAAPAECLYGSSPVVAALSAGRREVYKVFVQEGLGSSPTKGQVGRHQAGMSSGMGCITPYNPDPFSCRCQSRIKFSTPFSQGGKDPALAARIRRLAEAAGAIVEEASKHTLNLLSENRPHQGVCADVGPLTMPELGEVPREWAACMRTLTLTPMHGSRVTTWRTHRDTRLRLSHAGVAAGARPLWLALDQVSDPQNLGAVIRSAHFLGVTGVVLCAKNSAPLSPVVSKASAGALEVRSRSPLTQREPRSQACPEPWSPPLRR